MDREAIFGRMLLFTREKSHHTRSDKYSQIISLGNLAMATLVDELFKYQPWAMSYNVLVLTCSPERDGAVGLLGGPERKTRATQGGVLLLLHVVLAGHAKTERCASVAPSAGGLSASPSCQPEG